jgi:hypothetical protein
MFPYLKFMFYYNFPCVSFLEHVEGLVPPPQIQYDTSREDSMWSSQAEIPTSGGSLRFGSYI